MTGLAHMKQTSASGSSWAAVGLSTAAVSGALKGASGFFESITGGGTLPLVEVEAPPRAGCPCPRPRPRPRLEAFAGRPLARDASPLGRDEFADGEPAAGAGSWDAMVPTMGGYLSARRGVVDLCGRFAVAGHLVVELSDNGRVLVSLVDTCELPGKGPAACFVGRDRCDGGGKESRRKSGCRRVFKHRRSCQSRASAGCSIVRASGGGQE